MRSKMKLEPQKILRSIYLLTYEYSVQTPNQYKYMKIIPYPKVDTCLKTGLCPCLKSKEMEVSPARQSARVCEVEDCTQKYPGEQLDWVPYGWTSDF